MKTATWVMLSAAPGVAVGYFLLTGYLLNRVKPLPIANMPWPDAPENKKQPQAGPA